MIFECYKLHICFVNINIHIQIQGDVVRNVFGSEEKIAASVGKVSKIVSHNFDQIVRNQFGSLQHGMCECKIKLT